MWHVIKRHKSSKCYGVEIEQGNCQKNCYWSKFHGRWCPRKIGTQYKLSMASMIQVNLLISLESIDGQTHKET
jgi:hypothetical protein